MRPRACFEGVWLAVPCLVDSAGIQLTQVGDLTPRCAAFDRVYLNVDGLTAQPALREQSVAALQTMLVDSSCAPSVSTSQTEQFGAESFAASGECIPAELTPGMSHSLAGLAQ
jgi:alpha-galactosidase/6-phospho-beta-glucosidase family protein